DARRRCPNPDRPIRADGDALVVCGRAGDIESGPCGGELRTAAVLIRLHWLLRDVHSCYRGHPQTPRIVLQQSLRAEVDQSIAHPEHLQARGVVPLDAYRYNRDSAEASADLRE